MSFRAVFIAVVIATGMNVAAFMINRMRPPVDVAQASAEFVRATGKCASCHARETSGVVHEFEMSAHAARASTVSIVIGRSRARSRSSIEASSSPRG